MDWSLSSIGASLSRVTRHAYNRAGRTLFPKRGRIPREAHLFLQQAQPTWDILSIGRALVSATVEGMAAKGALFLLPDAKQDMLVVAASDGVDEPCTVALQPRSPFFAWLRVQHRVVTASELGSLPQWQGLASNERDGLLSFGADLFAYVRSGEEPGALLVVGRKKGDISYTREEVDDLGLLVDHAAVAMEMALLHHQLEQGKRELHQARGQLAGSAGMATIGEAVSASAQEMQGSLRTIRVLIEGMKREASGRGASIQTLDVLEAEIFRIQETLQPLLETALEEQWAWGEHGLNSLVSSAVSAIGLNATGSRVEVALDLAPGEPRVWCDDERMRQVFVNVAANALDAMPERGVLTVSTKIVGDSVQITFADSGIGIPAEHLERVFEPFFTSKPDGKGSGVGLASSRMTVERHQGSITVESEVGKGTTVTIVLPVLAT